MVTFRNNNNKRSNFRRNDRNFKSNNNVDRVKFSSNFSNNENFQRTSPGRNDHSAPKLIEKYNNLAREALSAGDKILSENYFQHADHFTRILNEQESFKKKRQSDKVTDISTSVDNEVVEKELVEKDSEESVSSETQKKIV